MRDQASYRRELDALTDALALTLVEIHETGDRSDERVTVLEERRAAIAQRIAVVEGLVLP